MHASLREEATAQRAKARRACSDGEISYRGYLADLGKAALSVLTGPSVAALLQALFDRQFVLTRGSSCYTYYETGDFLSVHRDGADDCEVTMLVYLETVAAEPDATDSGLYLQLHDDDAGKPGAVSRRIRTLENRIVVGFGSRIWHARPRLQEGERVSLLTACFSTSPA